MEKKCLHVGKYVEYRRIYCDKCKAKVLVYVKSFDDLSKLSFGETCYLDRLGVLVSYQRGEVKK